MSIECVWRGEAPERPWVPGEMFWSPYRMLLSRHYLADVEPVRRPLAVVIPTYSGHATWFGIDTHPTDKPDEAWTVTVDLDSLVVGAKPRITVQPSIHCIGLWHGWLVDGILTGDEDNPPAEWLAQRTATGEL